MIHLTINHNTQIKKAKISSGTLLLDALQKSATGIQPQCGGKGLCKKCLVEIKDIGKVLACQYVLTHDCEVIIPDKRDAAILSIWSDHIKPGSNNAGIAKDMVKQGDPFGFAVDIGTTTVVVYLVNLKEYSLKDTVSFLNPQDKYGQDVISRIHHTMENKRGLKALQQSIIDAINKALNTLCSKHKITRKNLVKAVFAGNTTMLHLLLGIDPKSIALAPFTPAFVDEKRLAGNELGLDMNPKGTAIVLPSLSGYVGADITAGMSATALPDNDKYSIFIDIGTNGEIVLGNKEVIYCCSTAAGPAFEGARIQCGMGGVAGAISEFSDGQYKTIMDKKPAGICGSGLVDIAAHLLNKGLVSDQGFMEGDFLIEKQENTDTDHDIVFTPKDVRETQLAKAAVAAGIKILMQEAKVDASMIENVFLAGGFGSIINVKNAVCIGLIPKALEEKVKPVGNSAGAGAFLALKSTDFQDEIKTVIAKCKYIELSMRADFNDAFVDEIEF